MTEERTVEATRTLAVEDAFADLADGIQADTRVIIFWRTRGAEERALFH